MMKFFLVIICVAGMFSVDSTPVKGAVDWPQVKDRVSELKGIFSDVVTNVRNIIKSANNETLSKFDGGVALGQEHFAKIDKLVDGEKLTEEEAKKEFNEMKENLSKIKADILSQLEKSAPVDAKKIEEAVEESKKKCEPKKEELYALLRA